MLQPVMEGVAALHKAGLVHRGVSPANILLAAGGSARLCGYGTLGLRTAGSELKSQLYDGYSAPEQYSPAEFEGRYTDVYGLAAVFYRLVTGQAPVSAVQRKVSDSLLAAQEVEPAVPGYLSNVLEAALALAPGDRLQNVPRADGGAYQPARGRKPYKAGAARPPGRAHQREKLVCRQFGGHSGALLLLMWSILDRNAPAAESQPMSTPPASSGPAQIKTIPDFVGLTFCR